jgi:cyclopropane fatty-acyl-phospholipid synthase-like methyltransferase
LKLAGKDGPEFFDDPDVFDIYLSKRSFSGNPNETLERPVLGELIGEMRGLRILDLGCGDARIGLDAFETGCAAYVGIEGSHNMAKLARETLAATPGQVHEVKIEDWVFPEGEFDLVISRLALHYVDDMRSLFASVYRSLVSEGRFIFSVEHPVITSSDRAYRNGERRQEWIVDNYFETGVRLTKWMGAEVIKYHRTVEDYFMNLRSAGFRIDAVRESKPQRSMFTDEKIYERRMRIPLMLFFSCARSLGDASR